MLTPQQTRNILAKLKVAGLKYQEVYEELLDHYTMAVEVKIQEGKSFEQALEEVHKDFGGNKSVKLIEKRYNKQLFRF